ncbi:hypothetical protein ACTHAM_001080 [Cellulomonas soli]|uniref:hypothetical protein n=1 Tax=Cellulomonas soli TaxID=931535 RepID=UPI001DFF4AED|nr:hypothetical protein [Cellulomonadaceae bacterium]
MTFIGQPTDWRLPVLDNRALVVAGKSTLYLDAAMTLYDGYEKYTDRYGGVSDPMLRAGLTVGRTATTTATGVAVGTTVTVVLLGLACPFTAGATCAVAVVVGASAAGGIAGYYAEKESGEAFDSLVGNRAGASSRP